MLPVFLSARRHEQEEKNEQQRSPLHNIPLSERTTHSPLKIHFGLTEASHRVEVRELSRHEVVLHDDELKEIDFAGAIGGLDEAEVLVDTRQHVLLEDYERTVGGVVLTERLGDLLLDCP